MVGERYRDLIEAADKQSTTHLFFFKIIIDEPWLMNIVHCDLWLADGTTINFTQGQHQKLWKNCYL